MSVDRRTDPAVAAAERKAKSNGHRLSMREIAAAREALKPLRELHKPNTIRDYGETWTDCAHCGTPWPCATARLIYAEGELS